MISGLLMIYVAVCSPTLTFCVGKHIIKGTIQLSKSFNESLKKYQVL